MEPYAPSDARVFTIRCADDADIDGKDGKDDKDGAQVSAPPLRRLRSPRLVPGALVALGGHLAVAFSFFGRCSVSSSCS